MFQQDYVLRQIEMLTAFLVSLFFDQEVEKYQFLKERRMESVDPLFLELRGLVDAGQINEAEDLLFSQLQERGIALLEVMVSFYDLLGAKTNDELEQAHFSRAEVLQGLTEATRLCGIEIR